MADVSLSLTVELCPHSPSPLGGWRAKLEASCSNPALAFLVTSPHPHATEEVEAPHRGCHISKQDTLITQESAEVFKALCG